MKPPMTDAQKEVRDFIALYWEVKGRNPYIREMCDGKLDGKQIMPRRASKNAIYEIVGRLVDKGHLIQDWHKNVTFWRVAEP